MQVIDREEVNLIGIDRAGVLIEKSIDREE